jgi:hypothetical protein
MKTSKREKIELPKRLDYNTDLEELSKHSSNHKEELQQVKEAGCYYCNSIFPTSTIKEWCDKGSTALCPNCGIDSVIPNEDGLLTHTILSAMYQYWFDGVAYAVKMKDGKAVDIVDESGLYDPTEFEVFRQRQLEVWENKV